MQLNEGTQTDQLRFSRQCPGGQKRRLPRRGRLCGDIGRGQGPNHQSRNNKEFWWPRAVGRATGACYSFQGVLPLSLFPGPLEDELCCLRPPLPKNTRSTTVDGGWMVTHPPPGSAHTHGSLILSVLGNCAGYFSFCCLKVAAKSNSKTGGLILAADLRLLLIASGKTCW